MIRLNLPKEPYDIALPHGVTVTVVPLTTAVYEAARSTALRRSRELIAEHEAVTDVGGDLSGLPDLSDPDALDGVQQMIFAQALAGHGIVAWDGVYDAAGKEPQPLAADAVKDLMRLHGMAEAFVARYTRTHADLVMEGNGFGAARNGISATAPGTAKTARPKTRPARRASAG